MSDEPVKAARKFFKATTFHHAEPPHAMVVMREYDDGAVEFWATRLIPLSDGRQFPKPYKIDAQNPAEAVEKIDSAWALVQEAAINEINRQLDASKKIVLASEVSAEQARLLSKKLVN